MSEQTRWQASQAEHRIAWITAGICIAMLFIASLRPQWFEFSLPSFDPDSRYTNLHEDEPQPQQLASQVTLEPPATVIPPAAEKKIATVTPSTPVLEPAKKSPAKTVSSEPPASHHVTRQPAQAAQPANGYYVQLGAFSEQPRAQGLADRLTSLGFQAHVVIRGKLHAVWAGPATSQLKAEQLQKAIASRLPNKGFITHQTGM